MNLLGGQAPVGGLALWNLTEPAALGSGLYARVFIARAEKLLVKLQ